MSTTPPPGVNPDLAAIHASLIARMQDMQAALAKAADAGEVIAILDQITEINARVTAVGARMFAQQSDALAALSQHVLAAGEEAGRASARLDGLVGAIQSVTKFLALVDEAIGLAKAMI